MNDIRGMLGHQHEHLLKLQQGLEIQMHISRRILHKIGKIMPTIDEINAQVANAMTKLQANTDALAGISTFIADTRTELAAVRQQLQDLIDAGTTTPAQLQSVSDNLAALEAGLDAQAVKEAAVLNTPDDPND